MAPAAGLTQQQIATFRHVFDALFDFLAWTYGIVLGGLDRTVVQNRILGGWAHPDGSTRELLTYLGGLHTTIFGEAPARRERYRGEVRRLLASMFAASDPTERGEVLALLHRTLEAARPGCTGVAPSRVASPRGAAPSSARGVPAAGSAVPPAGAGVASAPPPFAATATPHAAPLHPYAAAPLHAAAAASAAPTSAAPAAPPPVPPLHDPDLPLDVQRVRDETARYQALLMDQKIWEMRSNLATEVIRSMR
jgi:hypothetical protein